MFNKDGEGDKKDHLVGEWEQEERDGRWAGRQVDRDDRQAET